VADMMEKMIFKNFLLHSKTVKETFNLPQDFSVQGISTDSRTLQMGEVFVALRGDNFDGHDFLEMAVHRGAAALVIASDRHYGELSEKIPVIRTPDTLHFLMEYAGWYRLQFNLPVIGLTGSTGKTTCKEMLAAVLNRKYQVVKTQKNLNNFIGVPLTLLQLQKNIEIAIVEMGSNHPGEIATLTELVKPTQAAITNIGSGHIGFFGSREAIFNEKKALFDGMPPGSKIFLNMEDTLLRNYRRKVLTIYTYGLRGDYTYQATLVNVDRRGHVYFQINHGPEIRLAIPGRHQWINALLAGSIGLDAGISPLEVKEALESVSLIDKRMEVIEHRGITIINDAYNSNPESLRVAIDHLLDLSTPKNSRKFLVIGDMLELGEYSEEEHRRIGLYLQDKKIDYVFCLGPHCYQIVEILSKTENSSIQSQFFASHKELAEVLNILLRRQDIMLLKGSRGMAMEKILDFLEIKG
jgi:UDP-N-acetylmuramoyl-tripeptide--D-alanyl-D-alanine ligase